MGPVFYWRVDDGPSVRAFTARSGGVSEGPYAALNLGGHVGDDATAVLENRRRLAAALALDVERVVYMDQHHGAEVAVVEGPVDAPPPVDALITEVPDLALVAMVADCVPVLIWDADGPAIAAVHAGRPGLLAGVVPATVAALRDLGARRLRATVGPSVCARCYEVPVDLREAAAAIRPEARAISWTGTPAIDVAAGVVAQLAADAVTVDWVPGCTREDPALFSHRREGRTGRSAGVIVRRSA